MQSRMDKYNNASQQTTSRTRKNQSLYENVRNSELTEFDINSNISVIDDNAEHIDVAKIREMLDQKYSADVPKRRSIELPDYDEPVIIDEPIADTKEYDINAILAKAKKGKNVDYNKERLKKIREAQFEILNNLDLELKKVEEPQNKKNKEAEDNLINLINTITELELKNKKTPTSEESSEALELLSDLKGNEEEEEKTIKDKEEQVQEEDTSDTSVGLNTLQKQEEAEDTKETHIEKTLSKLNIDMSSYDDFSDVSKRDNGMLVIKIIIFLVIISLVIGAVYILDNILGLGLF